MSTKVELQWIWTDIKKEKIFIEKRPRLLKYKDQIFKRTGPDEYLEYLGDLDPDDDLGIVLE